MELGDAFTFVDSRVDPHLWFLASDPDQDPDRVLLLSFTTSHPKKEAVCVFKRGEHPLIVHESVVAYRYAKAVTLEKLDDLVANGKIRSQDGLSHEQLARVHAGAAISRKLSIEFRELLDGQGLLP